MSPMSALKSLFAASSVALLLAAPASAQNTPGVTFVGRLATYRYYNMDQVVAQALATYQKLQQPEAAPEAVAAT